MVDFIIEILAKIPALDAAFNLLSLLPRLLRTVIGGIEEVLNYLNQVLEFIENLCLKIGKKKEEFRSEGKL